VAARRRRGAVLVKPTAVLDVAALPVPETGRQPPIYWGMCGLLIVETTVFASLIATYLYLRLVAPSWPPAGIKPPDLLLPTINTVVLVVSAYTMHRADSGIREGDQRWLKVGMLLSLTLAVAFLVIKTIEYSSVEYRWDSHAYGSIVWTITGFHSLHVILLILKTLVMLVLAFRGYFSAERNIGVQVNGLYWNFVVLIWLPLYALLYFGPRVLD
jgi:cytochrome c oxidase subunit III